MVLMSNWLILGILVEESEIGLALLLHLVLLRLVILVVGVINMIVNAT